MKLPLGVVQLKDSATPPMGMKTRDFTFAVAQPGTFVVKGIYERAHPKKLADSFALAIYANPHSWPAPRLVVTDLNEGLGTDVGATFVIDLEENASAGYSWTMRFGPGLRVLHELTATPSTTSSRMVGAGGQQLWLVRIEKSGKTGVTGLYERPSGPASSATLRFSLAVTTVSDSSASP